VRAVCAALLIFAVATGCPGGRQAPVEVAPTASAQAPKKLAGQLRVFAAASLAEAFTALGAAFEAKNPEVKVELSFGSSTAHERQIEAGAACDLYVSAAQANVDRLAAASLIDSSTVEVVARNALVVIVPEQDIAPGDLASLEIYPRIAAGARGVPVGDYARAALEGIVAEDKLAGYPDEPSVVTAVAQGAAPVGICYASSLVSHPRRKDVRKAFDLEAKTPIVYPAALVRGARSPELARAFVELLRSPAGRAELTKYGFAE
jgi:molybdate transport system substrate-binding protein